MGELCEMLAQNKLIVFVVYQLFYSNFSIALILDTLYCILLILQKYNTNIKHKLVNNIMDK